MQRSAQTDPNIFLQVINVIQKSKYKEAEYIKLCKTFKLGIF